MAQSVYETVCPACSHVFELPEDVTEGTCPRCNTFLRFVQDEGSAPAADEPAPAPPPTEAAAPPATMPAEAAPPPAQVPTPRIGEFRVECPACDQAFNVPAEADFADCPACASHLRLEDQFAERGVEYPVPCPNCQRLHEVPLGVQSGACPHCGARLDYEDVMPGAAEESSEEEPTEPAAMTATVEEPRPQPAPEAEADVESAPLTPSSAATDQVPLAQAPPEGVPTIVDCPSCKKSFGIPPKATEGNCPHCNVPLAFVSEKEHQALLDAEERKKRFQQKLAERRLKRKEQDLARQKAKDEKVAARQGPGGGALRFLRREKRPEAPAGAPGAPPASVPVEVEIATSAAEPAPAPEKKRRVPKVGPAPVVEEAPALVEAAPVTLEAAPAAIEAAPIEIEAAAPPATEPEKRSRFAFLRRARKEQPAAGPPAQVESDVVMLETAAPAQAPPPKGRKGGSKQEPAFAAPVEVSIEEPTIEVGDVVVPSQEAKAKGRKAKGSAPVEVVSEPTFEIASEPSIEIAAEPATAPSSGAPTKKGLFGRFKKTSTPEAPPATVETGGIDVEISAEPQATTATVEVGDIGFDSAVEAAPAPAAKKAKRGKGPAPPAEIEMGEVVFDASPSAAPEAEISIHIAEAATAAPPKKRRR